MSEKARRKAKHSTATEQGRESRQYQTSLQRKMRSLLLLAVSSSAIIATPQVVRADFMPNPSPPNYVASGTEPTPQSITEDNVSVTTDDTFSVTTSEGNALTITGNGALVYSDANAAELVATGNYGALVVHSTGDDGIFGEDGYTRGKVTITTNGDLTGGSVGMDVTNSGSDRTNITSTGTVTATDSSGIGVKVTHGASAYDMTVKVADVTGGQTGISIQKQGIGGTDLIATGTVIGTSGTGVFVTDNSAASSTKVTVAGVTGGTDGVRLEGYSIGDATITATGTVTGTTGTGIAANYNNTSGHDLTVKAAAVTGGQTGISALNKGRGDTSITATGTVAATGTSSTGIVVTNEENTVDLTVNAASVSGGEIGIKATNNGTGNTSVTATGTVTATNGIGIDVTNGENAIDLTVNAAAVTSGGNGISAVNNGTGNINVTATGTVDAEGALGIDARNSEAGQNITVTAVDVTGEASGIYVINEGTGNTSITSTGTATGNLRAGISVSNRENAQNLTVNAVNATGGETGIFANNQGTGNTRITATGTITGTLNYGIDVENGENAGDLTVEAATVTGGFFGIDATNNGTGDTSITATGTVTGTGSHGIRVVNGDNAVDLTVEAVDVNGDEYGIEATNNGSGNTSITATGTVEASGTYSTGINATNNNSSKDLTIDVAAVSGGSSGIYATNNGTGNTSITATGTVEATNINGIFVTNGADTGNLTVNAAAVSGGSFGINASNSGTGDTTITATGDVEGTTNNGISVTNGVNTNDLTVDVAGVSGTYYGISANNNGGGDTSITATGTVIATNSSSTGIDVRNYGNAHDLTVEVAAVSGGSYGINVSNNGDGDTTITATGTVTGTGSSSTGIYAMNSATTNDLTIETAAVSSNNYGITALNYGSGDTSITATGDITASGFTGEGITVVDSSTSTEVNEITVDVVNVSGSSYGISVNNNGYGSATITATGTVEATGTYSTGIYVASTFNTQDLTVNAADVSGGDYGINTRNSGSGDTTITATGTVTGTRTGGIYAENNSNANDITIEAAAVSGSVNGISATNYGKGDTSVKATGDVTSTANFSNGINAVNYNTAQDLTVEATNVTSSYNGISATNYGSGDTKITVTGDVEGTGGNGIIVSNSGSESQDLTVEAVNVTGNEYGISATNNGTGNTSITATGDVIATGTNGTGISVTDSSTSTEVNELTVDVVNVTGGSYGISVNNNGYGSATITATGTVEATGTYSTGIYVASTFNTQDLIVNAAAVSGGDYGIYTRNNGKGDTSITATGTVTGTRSSGIYAENSTYANDITIEAAAVSGSDNGIYASNFGIGNTSVKATGDVTSTANSSNGIYAVNYNTAKDLTVEATKVTSAYHGINATNYGSGDTKITATGDVTGTGGTGIIVYNDVIAQDLTVEAAAVTGNEYGIYTENYGTGITSITATGLVEATGEGSTGINAYNGGETSDLTVEAAAVTGGDVGINANNEGDGDTRITATGTVEGTSNIGIQVGNGENANDLTVEAAAVTGGNSGIVANNYGNGNSSVTATGLVEGGTDAGIRVINGENAVDLTVEAAAVTGAIYGINTENNGTGDTSITATGTVTGTDFVGIEILNGENTGDLTVEAAAVTGGNTGISVNNNGSGNTSVTATGLVTGTNETGVYANNNAGAVNLTVEVAGVDGNNFGVNANNDGSGSTRVAATGTVNATGAEGIGIQANNGGEATDLTVEAAAVTGTNTGITATNNGTGTTSVTATGTVEGTDNDGIQATNGENATGLTVEAAAVTGGNIGIVANNDGSGSTSVTATGTVTGTNNTGINVNNNDNTQNLTVEAAAVTGGVDGINTVNYGSGNTSITATGLVTGTDYAGISAYNGEDAVDLTVEAAAATGAEYGIYAENNGSGDTSVTATGLVTGTGAGSTAINVFSGSNTTGMTVDAAAVTGGDVGINANNEGSGDTLIKATGQVTGTNNIGIQIGNAENAHDLTVEAAAVTGYRMGIAVNNNGSGDTSVTSTGLVTATSTADDTESVGINVTNAVTAGSLTVNAASATGNQNGINTENNGSGTTTIAVSGVVEGGEAGIRANADGGKTIRITNEGTVRNSSQSTTDQAIVSEAGEVEINNNNLLTGTVALGDEGNTINNDGLWDVAGGTSELGGGINLIDNKADGSIRAAGLLGPTSTTFNGASAVIHSGAIVLQNQMAGGETAYAGDVATFTNGGDGDFRSNGGAVYLDTDFEAQTSDVLVVDNVSRQGNATALFINPATAGGQALAGDGIEVVDVQGTSTNDAFVLAEPVNAGLFSYGLGQGTQDSQSWFLQSSIRAEASAAGALSVLGSRTALSTLPGMNDRLREDYDEEERYGSRSGARLVSRDLTLPDAKPQATKGVWGRVLGESSEFKSKNGVGYDAKLWGAQAGLDFYAISNQQGDRQVAGVYLGHASASGDALGGSGVIGSLNVDATTVGAYYTFSSSRGWYVDATAQYSWLGDMKLATGSETVRPDGSSYAVSLEAGKVLNSQSKLRTELQAQVIYQKTDVDDITLSDNTRLTLGGLTTTTGRIGVRLSKNPQYAGRFQPWVRANLWHTLNEDATVSSLGATTGTAIGGTSGEVQVGFALTPSQASSWSAYAAAGYTFDLSGAQYSGWKGTVGLRKGW